MMPEPTPHRRSSMDSPGRRLGRRGAFRLAFFLFAMSSLLLVARRGIHSSDGYFEYQVAERIVQSGRLDLPQYAGTGENRVQRGTDGNYYAVYGIGQSVLYTATIWMDRALIWTIDRVNVSGFGFEPPFLFSISANAFVLSATLVLLHSTFRHLGISPAPALFSALVYGFATMALAYAQLSFDICLASLLLLGMYACHFHSLERPECKYLLLAGLLYGALLNTKVAFGVLAAPMLATYAWKWISGQEGWRSLSKRLLLISAGAAPLVGLFFFYNEYRFGSIFNTGYGLIQPLSDSFSISTLPASVPALLLSPGRSLFLYSPPVLLSLFGLRTFFRERREVAINVYAVILINFLLFSLWYWWHSRGAWGPRFQFATVLFLMFPAAYWLNRHWSLVSGRYRWVAIAVFAGCFILQLSAVLSGIPRMPRDLSEYWGISSFQGIDSISRTAEFLMKSEFLELNILWADPVFEHSLTARLMALALIMLAALAARYVLRHYEEL